MQKGKIFLSVVSLAILAVPALAMANPFEGCGTLVQGTECVLFEADAGGVYLLDNLGDFEVSDYVHVEGTLDEECVTICQEDDGCIYDVVITDCLLSVDACGTLVQGTECVLWQADNDAGLWFGDFAGYDVGDYVHIVGVADPHCVNTCQEGDGCVEISIIEACDTVQFDGCGTLVQGTECVLFQADDDGGLWFGDFGDYVVGDRVNILGLLDPDCINICQEGDGCIDVLVITDCDIIAVDACGTLVQGTECVLWQADNDAGLWFGDFAGYDVGDYVHIVGYADPDCVNICQEGDGCVEINIIEACDTVPFDGCGTLVQGTECVLFQADNDGGLWFGDFGDYVVGDTVHILGLLDPDCVNICQEGDGCIDIHVITDCEVATEEQSWSNLKKMYR